jgi:hypothetical protein
MRSKGAVGYSTARYEGETAEDERHATVAVLLEIGPQFDDERILSDPNVRRVMAAQARAEADELFKFHHQNAIIEHIDVPSMGVAEFSNHQATWPKTKTEALFVGGPYDGVKLKIEHVNAYGLINSVGNERGLRLFVLLPPLDVWERLIRGEITKDKAFDVLYCYERKFIPGGAEFHYGSVDTLSQAFAEQSLRG